MDRPGQHRDMVYCHQCENEWYRDEHGLSCPDCHSDFTEIIEPDHDPRREEPPFPSDFPGELPEHAPDPDEGHIDHIVWRPNGPGRYTVNATLYRNFPGGNNAGGPPQQPLNPVAGILSQMMRNITGADMPLNPNYQQQPRDQGQPGSPLGGQRLGSGSPPPAPGEPHVHIRSGSGPGFRYTTTTRLAPRDPENPHLDFPVDDLQHLITHLIMGSGMGAPPGHPAHNAHARGNSPFGGGGLLGALFAPPGGAFGDAVYSQEALDRIISQLMEQNNMGNAPGPASAEAISNLPKVPLDKSMAGQDGAADCSICMDEVPMGEMVTKLYCGHWFHGDCVAAWLREHDTCPCCRKGIMSEGQNRNGQGQQASPRSPTNTMPGAFDSGDEGRRSSRASTGAAGLGERVRGLFRGSSSNSSNPNPDTSGHRDR